MTIKSSLILSANVFIALHTPVLVRSLPLSNVEREKYLDDQQKF